MINAIIIDDETNAVEVLEMQIAKYCKEVTIIAKATNAKDGIELIKQQEPDLVFLDIEMPHKNGFDVLNETRNYNYKVIFTTAYDQFAIKAFKFSAIDYLLKPIDISELQLAVEKLSKKDNISSFEERIKTLFGQLEHPSRKEKIALPVGEAMQFFNTDDIVRCESESNYTHIFLLKGTKIIVAKTLKEVEKNLKSSGFCRIHQSHLINMNHISKVVKGDKPYVLMNDGTTLSISRNNKETFLESFRKI